MERLRKGNDFDILWDIVAGGNDSNIPYDLTGKNLEVFMINAYERVAVKNFKVEGNTISWRYLGKDQQRRGIYSLLLIENEGKEGMHTVDECKAFELVDCSCMEGGEAESHVRIETIRLKSGISVNSIVPDKKLDVDSGNVVENATIAKEFQRVDNDIKRVSDTVENQGREIVNLGETLSEHGDALEAHGETLDAHGKAISAIEKKNTEQDTAIGKKAEQSALEGLEEIVSGKAEQNGVYPDMTVGLAEDLGGRPYYDDAEFSFRASAGSDTSIKDGMASIKELRGNSVVWNQLRGNAGRVSDDSKDGLTILTAIDSPYISIVGTPTHDDIIAYNAGTFPAINGIEGHKYVGAIRGNTHVLLIVYGGADFATASAGIFTCTSSSALNFVPQIKNKAGVSINEEVALLCYDLTLMFGAGNEPVTIDEFYARMPIGVDMSAYNEGEVIHMAADGIKSVGDNAWDEEWEQGAILDNGQLDPAVTYMRSKNYTRVIQGEQYYALKPAGVLLILALYDINKNFIKTADLFSTAGSGGLFTIPSGVYYIKLSAYTYPYNNDIMISLVHSGWKQDTDAKYQPYWADTLLIDQRIKGAFPEGLQKWDKVYNKNGKGYIVKGTGKVDMGSMTWYTSEGVSGVILMTSQSLMEDVFSPADTGVVGGFVCSQFVARSANDTYVGIQGISVNQMGEIKLYDSAYTDAAAFKAAMAGVPLYYELATPEVIEYDEPFNLDYRVADFGTEEVISDQPSAPMAAEIQYNFNANDTIRTNRIAIRDMHREIAELRAMISAMQVQLTNKEDEA